MLIRTSALYKQNATARFPVDLHCQLMLPVEFLEECIVSGLTVFKKSTEVSHNRVSLQTLDFAPCLYLTQNDRETAQRFISISSIL